DRVAENEHKKAEKEYKDVIERLKSEKVAALDEGDNRRVVELDDQILNTEKPVEEPQEDVVFKQWNKGNEWYDNDQFLAVQADMVAQQYLNKGLRGKELLDTMTEHMKTAYPDRFKKDSDRPASVEGGTVRPRTPSKNLSEKDLTPDERAVFKNFNRMNMFKDDAAKTKYFKEVIELRD
ncbi:MAG: hypothetical protein JRE23_15540, partial [Deltaproteobacteria bacterium]|nr:hypothetical protein [Deltaproteobacteria bacterium]